jgi:hypothetical protein
MTSNSGAGFVWRPLRASRPWRWASIGIVIAAVVVGFVAGRVSIIVNPSSVPQSVASAAHSKTSPAPSAKAFEASATAAVAQQRPTPYVVINPGTTIDIAADDRRATIGDRNRDITPTEAKAEASAAPSYPLAKKARPALPSKMKQARSQRRLKTPASDYRSLREYVLKQ